MTRVRFRAVLAMQPGGFRLAISSIQLPSIVHAGINRFWDLAGADVAVRSFALSLALEGSL